MSERWRFLLKQRYLLKLRVLLFFYTNSFSFSAIPSTQNGIYTVPVSFLSLFSILLLITSFRCQVHLIELPSAAGRQSCSRQVSYFYVVYIASLSVHCCTVMVMMMVYCWPTTDAAKRRRVQLCTATVLASVHCQCDASHRCSYTHTVYLPLSKMMIGDKWACPLWQQTGRLLSSSFHKQL